MNLNDRHVNFEDNAKFENLNERLHCCVAE